MFYFEQRIIYSSLRVKLPSNVTHTQSTHTQSTHTQSTHSPHTVHTSLHTVHTQSTHIFMFSMWRFMWFVFNIFFTYCLWSFRLCHSYVTLLHFVSFCICTFHLVYLFIFAYYFACWRCAIRYMLHFPFCRLARRNWDIRWNTPRHADITHRSKTLRQIFCGTLPLLGRTLRTAVTNREV